MANSITVTQIPERIHELLQERQHHADAIALIDKTLESVGMALGVAATAPKSPKAKASSAADAPAVKGRKRGRRSKYATSAEDSILAFVKEQKNPSTKDIKQHYFSEGRGGSADNVLSKLFREKRIKRTPLGPGIRGSRYSLP